jgi:hypothetical protein
MFLDYSVTYVPRLYPNPRLTLVAADGRVSVVGLIDPQEYLLVGDAIRFFSSAPAAELGR